MSMRLIWLRVFRLISKTRNFSRRWKKFSYFSFFDSPTNTFSYLWGISPFQHATSTSNITVMPRQGHFCRGFNTHLSVRVERVNLALKSPIKWRAPIASFIISQLSIVYLASFTMERRLEWCCRTIVSTLVSSSIWYPSIHGWCSTKDIVRYTLWEMRPETLKDRNL